MKFRNLGNTSIKVSEICLGTMTWGEQNTLSDAKEQLDLAIEKGVNFIDTAELYPIPPIPETQGKTEQFIGKWLQDNPSKRDNIIIASKVIAATNNYDYSYIRNNANLSRRNIESALHESLRRMNTDHIDLYQLHWPDRKTNNFGTLDYQEAELSAVKFQEILETLQKFIEEGKILHIGISNETPYGLAEYVRLSEQFGLPRVVSIQNPYNLLNRSFDIGLAEMATRYKCGLLAYSPLGFGTLSGKYQDGNMPANSRLALFDRFKRYLAPVATEATSKYITIARKYGLDPAQMAIAYILTKSYCNSVIIGATTITQLQDNIDACELVLNNDVITEIDHVHLSHPNPCP
jgi:aryl-alcohol dehydrogenase-like predicted oxidoreductase